jgi:hypothetical protein
MGLFSKLWKGIKKTVKKIGKGIKKVFHKVMNGIGKLGIVGQIGMMFLMPYAMSGLGSLFGTAGKLASWSTKLMGPNANIFSKALGKTLEMINVGGTWVKNAYTSVSTAIGNGIDRVGNFFKGDGFALSADRTSVFSQDFRQSLDTLPTQKGIKADQLKAEQLKAEQLKLQSEQRLKNAIDQSMKNPTGEYVMKDGKLTYESYYKSGELNLDSLNLDTKNIDLSQYGLTDTSSLTKNLKLGDTGYLTNSVNNFDFKAGSINMDNYFNTLTQPVPDGFMDSLLSGKSKGKGTGNFFKDVNIFDKNSAIRKDIADFDIYDVGKQQVFDGVMGGLKDEAYYAISPDSRPQAPIYSMINIPNVMGIGGLARDKQGMYNRITLSDVENFSAPRGNAWQATSMYNTAYMNQILNPTQGDDWRNFMNQFAYINADMRVA